MGDRDAERVDYDAELRLLHEALRHAYEIAAQDRVLDIGCGAGLTTRDAARLASDGWVLGVDISEEMIARARSLAEAEGLRNIMFERADAQDHRFPTERFDVAISRFGTMFFRDPVAAFTNFGQSIRPAGGLLLMVWQSHERNEWAVAIERALAATVGRSVPVPKAFSLGDPATVQGILDAAGFENITLTEVHEPVFYGRDVVAALDWVRGFGCTKEVLSRLDPAGAERALEPVRETLAVHASEGGIWFDSRAWIVRARRP